MMLSQIRTARRMGSCHRNGSDIGEAGLDSRNRGQVPTGRSLKTLNEIIGEIRASRMTAITIAKVATNETATATANQTAEVRHIMKVNPMPTAKMVI